MKLSLRCPGSRRSPRATCHRRRWSTCASTHGWDFGTLEEALAVAAAAAILPTWDAAVERMADSGRAADAADQRLRVPELHDALMPDVADELSAIGRHQQPGRTMSLTMNGQPRRTRSPARRHHCDQSVLREHPELRPSLEAIETVNVVTSSFDADQGWRAQPRSTCR